ncbi:DUF927 domain-containing protein [Neisseria shayeganii]|uniref:DUF927 domain-containing protein n=1 Tax=Neisseria shayeganii TaxID=607712 RepID=A0A7D7RMR1_9NEIS|nr:DUF927 domain-containing protein [Neisseria shayeganii]QMT40402.1 DUF927 domain-containing protein [Neisseria shayeganii]
MTDETKNRGADGRNGGRKPNMCLVKGKAGKGGQNVPISDLEALQGIADADASPLVPYYENRPDGLFFIGVGMTREGEPYHLPALHIADPIGLIGRGTGEDGKEYRIIEYARRGERQRQQAALPLEGVGMPDCWRFLRGLGIGIKSGGKAQGALADYLQWEGDLTDWQIANRGGWLNDDYTAYVLPSGEIIGRSDGKVIYNGDTSKKTAYTVSGTLESWQAEVARYAAGNSRLLLVLGAAFAAPLLAPMKLENGGFHLFHSSSGGKTTAAMLALSVFGNPDKLKNTWKATALAIDNIAAATSDGFMVLDEISQAKGQDVSSVAYSLFNGVGKLQGAKQGGNRERLEWRVLLLSTGEFDALHYMKQAGFEWNAGQNVRLPSVPADAGKGFRVFDTLHGFADGAEFAETLERAAKYHYGQAGRAFVAQVAAAMHRDKAGFIAKVNGLCQAFRQSLPELDGQPARVAKRFALVAAALELATEYGITGFAAGEGAAGVRACFQAWYEREGRGNYEERTILQRAIDFIQSKGNSEMFRRLEDIGADGIHTTSRYHAGYVEQRNGYAPVYYLTREAFETEVCGGYDKDFVCKVLFDAGWLRKGSSRWTKQLKRNGMTTAWFYVLEGSQPPERQPADGESLGGR